MLGRKLCVCREVDMQANKLFQTIAFSALTLLLGSLLNFAVCFGQAPFAENFDGVTAPALPSDWSSVSLAGTQVATTSSAGPFSGVNSALLPDPNVVSDTALVLPPLQFSTGASTYKLEVEFYHKRGMESNWDGGVLEVSVNGAAFVDVTDSSIGGVFTSGAYNVPALNAGSSLAGRPGWSGISPNYELVRITIPSLASGATVQFRFRIASDGSVSGPGWFIDEFELVPEVDLMVELIPSRTQVRAGDEVDFLVRLINPSSLNVPGGFFYVASSSGEEITSVSLTTSGLVQGYAPWVKVIQMASTVPPFGTLQFKVSAQTSDPPRAAAILQIDQATPNSFTGAKLPLSFLSSGAALPAGGFSDLPNFFAGIDLCTLPPGPPPPQAAGALVFGAPTSSCPLGQSALNAQQAGAAAFVRFGAPPPPPPPPIPAPYYEEPETAGLTIPAFGTSYFSVVAVGPVLGSPPGTNKFSVQGKKEPTRSTFVLSVSNLGYEDPILGNNQVAAAVEVYLDWDDDGVADDLDGCPNDAAKTEPGACGCGNPETDANANGVADCLLTQDYRAEARSLQSLVRKLRRKSFNAQRKLRKQIRAQQVLVTQRSSQAGISVASPTINLVKLARRLKKPVRALTSSASSFDVNKKAVLKEIKKLLSSLA